MAASRPLERIGDQIDRQHVQTDQIATAMHEMAVTVPEMVRNMVQAADAARRSEHEAANGSRPSG